MGADVSSFKCDGVPMASGDVTVHVPYNGVGLYCTADSRAKALAPPLLCVRIPRGAAYASGLYRLVPGLEANGQPVWRHGAADLWMYSTRGGKWGIGGRAEYEAAFQSGAAFVFCDTPHYGDAPSEMPADWLHNRPAWTLDPDISVESWPETITVTLHKAGPTDKYGLELALRPAAGGDDQALVLQSIAEGSLLARSNELMKQSGLRCQVVPTGSTVLRVGDAVEPEDIKAALLRDCGVEIVFARHVGPPPARPARWRAPEEELIVNASGATADAKASLDKLLPQVGSEHSTEGLSSTHSDTSSEVAAVPQPMVY